MPPRPLVKPRKQPQQARSEATVDALLSATARILARDGYDRASTNRIAEAAGVSPGSLYQYFPGKEALVAALIDRHRTRMNEVFARHVSAHAGAPVRDAIGGVVRATLEAQASDPVLHRALLDQVPRVGKLSDTLDHLDGEVARVVRAALELRRAELRVDDVETATFVVVHAVQALSDRIVRRPVAEHGRAIAAVVDMITRFLVP
jgi:AcrR family transcriptional regulator